MNSLTKHYVISKDASEVIDLLRFLSIVFVVLIHNTPVVPSRISFSSGMGQWFYGLMRHTILDPPIYVFFMISGLLLFRKPFGALENMKKKRELCWYPMYFGIYSGSAWCLLSKESALTILEHRIVSQ